MRESRTRADSDEELMRRYARGDVTAFQCLYDRHRGGVYRYLLRQTGVGVAEELFQDVWTSVIRARRRYRPSASFSTWLYTLARNRLIDHWRSSSRAPHTGSADQRELADERQASPLRHADLRDCIERLLALVQGLPDVQRDTFLLRHEAGLSLAEIAHAMQAKIETTRSRLRYAMEQLRLAMPAECLEESDYAG